MYHNFFIHLSANGHLGCFYVLAIVDSAAMNLGTCLLEVQFSQGICPVVVLLCHMVVLFLVFKEISILFSRVAVSICIPTNCAKKNFLSSTSSLGFKICRYFDDGHSDQMRWYFTVIFMCISLIISDVEHLYIFFGEISV